VRALAGSLRAEGATIWVAQEVRATVGDVGAEHRCTAGRTGGDRRGSCSGRERDGATVWSVAAARAQGRGVAARRRSARRRFGELQTVGPVLRARGGALPAVPARDLEEVAQARSRPIWTRSGPQGPWPTHGCSPGRGPSRRSVCRFARPRPKRSGWAGPIRTSSFYFFLYFFFL
jgi:hypothetical protein